MQQKSLGRIALACFTGAIVTGIISATVWGLLLFAILGVGKNPISDGIRAIDWFVIGVFIATVLGIIAGVMIGFIISLANLKPLKALLIGALVNYIFPILFFVNIVFDSIAKPTFGDDIKGFWEAAVIFFIPQVLIGSLSGLIMGFIFSRTKTVDEKPNI